MSARSRRARRAAARELPAELSFGALSLSVSTARRVSLVGIAALLLLAGVALAVRRRGGEPDEHEAIRSRYGHLLVPCRRALRRGGRS